MLGVMALSLGLTQLSTPSAPNAGRPQAAAAAGTVFAARRLFADMQFELISRLRVGSTAIGLVEGQDFDIRPSRGKGLGVYALRDIPAGTLLGRYTGKLYTLREADEALEERKTLLAAVFQVCRLHGDEVIVVVLDTAEEEPLAAVHSELRYSVEVEDG